MQTGVPVSSRGVMELVCALFGSDSVNHTQRAIVPLNVVWVQPFRFRQLVAGRRMYQVSKVPGPGDVLIASSACSILPKHRDRGHCFALPHFPLQSWRGVLPFQSLVPSKSCVYLPVTRLMQHIVTENPDENRYGPSVSVPCPPQPVRLLRWYDRGELWGRLTERPCLAMPLVLDHDRVNNTQTRTLKEQGLSHVGIKTIVERMLLLEMLGGENLLEEAGNCSWSLDGGYRISVSKFKGSSTAEADCGPLLDPTGAYPVWNSPRKCPHRINEYNSLLPHLNTRWHSSGYLVKRPMSTRSGANAARHRNGWSIECTCPLNKQLAHSSKITRSGVLTLPIWLSFCYKLQI